MQSLEELEAEYLGVSPECLHSIRHHERWGHRVLRFGEMKQIRGQEMIQLELLLVMVEVIAMNYK